MILKTIRRFVDRGQELLRHQRLGLTFHKRSNIARIGTAYGGWNVPVDLITSESICYCVGAGEDVSFDCGLIERFNCRVCTFDPTPRAVAHVAELGQRVRAGLPMNINNATQEFYSINKDNIDKLSFYPWGIWSTNETKRFYAPENEEWVSHSILNIQKTDTWFTVECYTIKTIMSKLGHKSVDLIKLNIEGAEYEVIRSLIADNIAIRVLCVKFDEGHRPMDGHSYARIKSCIRSLLDFGMKPIFMEGWNVTFIR